jgi:hypothetical protein
VTDPSAPALASSAPDPATDPATDLGDRYGRPGRRRWLLMGLSGGVALVFLGWLAWTIWSVSTPEVRSSLVGYDVVDAHESTAQVDVVLANRDVVGTCTVQAIAADHSIVGERVFTVPGPEADGRGTLEISIRTEREATSVDLLGCTTPNQSRPR